MAGSSLLVLIDDIATVLDDVAVLSKVAAKKTTGVLGDDLALNAQQVVGVAAEREIPVVLAVAKGSLINKIILVPAALLISSFAGFLVTPLLVLGGAFLCFEGFEKVFEKFFHKKSGPPIPEVPSLSPSDQHPPPNHQTPEQLEKEKIKGAIRTDFILSAEIIVITLGSVATASLQTRLLVLSIIGVVMTVGVYGLVALIVKMDDFGFYLRAKVGETWIRRRQRASGALIIRLAPLLMKALGVAGTIAMFLVGGGIITHAIPAVHHYQDSMAGWGILLMEAGVGLLSGGLIFGVVSFGHALKKKST